MINASSLVHTGFFHNWRRIAACALFAACSYVFAALPAGVTVGASVDGITEYTLANGLRVLLFPDPSRPKVTVNVTYLVGSRMENYGETGMAHLLEHMVFKGTPSRGNIQTALGQRGMSYNGTTSYDRTNYFETFTASDENLSWALEMEADRMVNSYVSRKDLDSEMTVVRNEMERGENDPQSVLGQRTLAASFGWHNYGKSPIGARSDVEGVDIGRLQAFYRLYYQPDNAVLVIAGAFDPDKALALVAKYFGPIPRPPRTLPRLYTIEPVQDGSRQVVVRRVADAQWLAASYHVLAGAHPDAVALEAATDIMTLTPSGRLYKSLVETKMAADVGGYVFGGFDPGFAMFLVQVPEKDPIDAARDVMVRTIEGAKQQPVSVAELDRVRARTLKNIDETISDPQRLGIALSSAIAQGDWRLFFLRRDRWRTVTPADVDRVAIAYFKPANRTVGEYLPDPAPDRSPAPPSVDVAAMVKDYKGDAPVAAGEAFDATPANLDARAQRFTLASGMKVVLLPKKTRGETVNFSLRLHYGDVASVVGKAGPGRLTGGMLMRGTTQHSRQEIEDALAKLKSTLTVQGDQTGTSAGGQTVRANLAPTLDLLAEVMRSPAFPPAELETLRRADITEIEQNRSDPQALAIRALRRYDNPYPKGDDRYVPTVEEEIGELRSPDVDALKRFYREFYGASTAEFSIVGDFDPATVKLQLERLFGTWASPSPFARVPQPLVTKKPTAVPIETPDKANAFYYALTSFPVNDSNPDYPALLVANHLLGGSANSRLHKRIRQQDGLSYGIGTQMRVSSFEPNSAMGMYAIFAPENLARLRSGVQEELDRLIRDGFTAEEIADGKRAVMQQRTLARSQDATLAATLAEQSYLGRTFATSGEIDRKIEALTPEQVNTAVRKYVKPDAFAAFFAGDFAKKK
ncbi:MAG: pitrilysin family protein [Betaproteobacteria bacterium]